MQHAGDVELATLEDQHWWFRGRHDCILRMTEGLGIPRKAKILELGCSGNGALLAHLAANGFTNLTGIDASEPAVTRAKSRGLSNIRIMDLSTPTLDQNSWDLLLASDILEHLEFPAIALENWCRLLKPEGKLIIFVPAYQALWSRHDEAHHHLRRYTRARLLEELRVAEFSILTSGYWNSIPFPAIAATRLAQRFRKTPTNGHDLHPTKPRLNKFLEKTLRFENALLRAGFRAPFGLTTWAIAERPPTNRPE